MPAAMPMSLLRTRRLEQVGADRDRRDDQRPEHDLGDRRAVVEPAVGEGVGRRRR